VEGAEKGLILAVWRFGRKKKEHPRKRGGAEVPNSLGIFQKRKGKTETKEVS
jgi:hypothetical protein